jgi:hypothetical protein
MPDPQHLHPDHPRTGTMAVVHLSPTDVATLLLFANGIPKAGLAMIEASGLSLMVELEPGDLSSTSLRANLKLKAGLRGAWTPEIVSAPAQVLPLYYPEPDPQAPIVGTVVESAP